MKKLVFAFILIFLFAGCSAKDITDDKDNSQSLVIENPTSYLNTLSEYADEITIEDIISDEKLKSLPATKTFENESSIGVEFKYNDKKFHIAFDKKSDYGCDITVTDGKKK